MPTPGVWPSLPSLAENAGLAFRGEAAWPPAQLAGRDARKLLISPNACGRPNSDVLRRRLGVAEEKPSEGWQVDFPTHFTEQEASLYEQPYALLLRRAGAWRNPHADAALRRALARPSRWLAMPAKADVPDWRWIEDDPLPDASLVVVARDDDFTRGVLGSTLFGRWWATYRRGPLCAIESFPFPWPPATPLSALTKLQEEHRHAIARAARGDDAAALRSAILAAYGWPIDLSDEEAGERLMALHRTRGSCASPERGPSGDGPSNAEVEQDPPLRD